MTEYIEDLAQTKLFSGIAPKEIAELLDCVHARRADYIKDDYIIEAGDRVRDIGIILSGQGRSFQWDMSDRQVIITLLQKGSETGVLLAAHSDCESPVSVQAQSDVSMLFIPYDRILARCGKACSRHERLLRNYIGIVAEKGLVLHERINCLLRPTVREKILAYLRRVSQEQQSVTFSIPMNRNAMSEYLNIERSALSRELSCMQKDGVIAYQRNWFSLV